MKEKGTKNKAILLQEAIYRTLDELPGGCDGYLRRLALGEPKVFAQLLVKLLPTKIANEDDQAFKIGIIERVIKKAK